MLNKILRKLLSPIFLQYQLHKNGSIWGFKEKLRQSKSPNDTQIMLYDKFFRAFGSWIGYNSVFKGVPCFPHGYYGVFVSGGAEIGENAVIFQQVTIGSNTLAGNKNFGSPKIGKNVYIGAGAKIIGNITIGDNCRIGANAVVYQDLPDNSVAVQASTRIIQKESLDNRFYSKRNGKWVYFNNGNWIKDDSFLTDN